MHEALDNTMSGLERRGLASPGFLYLGFILAEEFNGDPALLEYNVRFGDPEAQVILPLLGEEGIGINSLFYEAARGGLKGDRISVIEQHTGKAVLTVCLAAEGYPDVPRIGDIVYGIDRNYPRVTMHHGGTKHLPAEGGRIVTTAGRVAYATAIGDTMAEAAQRAYSAIGEDAVNFRGMHWRTGIGKKVVEASSEA
jgi:phosphoribosylamine--glycine ligase